MQQKYKSSPCSIWANAPRIKYKPSVFKNDYRMFGTGTCEVVYRKPSELVTIPENVSPLRDCKSA